MKKNEVYNCFEYAFRCPRTWESFATTNDPKVRFCDECRKNVHLCENAEELRAHVEQLFCVAFPPDFAVETIPGPVPVPLPPGMMMPLEYPPDGFAAVYLEPARALEKDEIDYLEFAFRVDREILRDAHLSGAPVVLSDHVPKDTAESIGERLKSRNIPHRIEAHPE